MTKYPHLTDETQHQQQIEQQKYLCSGFSVDPKIEFEIEKWLRLSI